MVQRLTERQDMRFSVMIIWSEIERSFPKKANRVFRTRSRGRLKIMFTNNLSLLLQAVSPKSVYRALRSPTRIVVVRKEVNLNVRKEDSDCY